MCWKSKEKKTSQIAGEDIFVYKVMLQNPDTGRYKSLYYEMEYEPGKVYSTYMEPIDVGPLCEKCRIMINKGFHSYNADKTEIVKGISMNHWSINSKETKDFWLDMIYGFSYLDDEYKELVAVKCIIPKGACYYENELGEMVSDQLMVTDNIIKRFKDIVM